MDTATIIARARVISTAALTYIMLGLAFLPLLAREVAEFADFIVTELGVPEDHGFVNLLGDLGRYIGYALAVLGFIVTAIRRHSPVPAEARAVLPPPGFQPPTMPTE